MARLYSYIPLEEARQRARTIDMVATREHTWDQSTDADTVDAGVVVVKAQVTGKQRYFNTAS